MRSDAALSQRLHTLQAALHRDADVLQRVASVQALTQQLQHAQSATTDAVITISDGAGASVIVPRKLDVEAYRMAPSVQQAWTSHLSTSLSAAPAAELLVLHAAPEDELQHPVDAAAGKRTTVTVLASAEGVRADATLEQVTLDQSLTLSPQERLARLHTELRLLDKHLLSLGE